MEDGKSHDLPFAIWKPRKASGIIQYKSKGLKTRGTKGVSHSLRTGEDKMRCPSSSNEAEKKGVNSSFLCLFVQCRPLVEWMRMIPTHKGEDLLF